MYYVESLENCVTELNKNLSRLDKNEWGREISIITRSIENLDKMLGLFDLSDETNLDNANQLASVISDHINARYNVKQPGSPMIDYELTMIQSWIGYIYTRLESTNMLGLLPDQIVKNREETAKITGEQRAEYKKQVEQMEAEKAQMDAEQAKLEEDRISQESTNDAAQPVINEEDTPANQDGMDVKDL